MSGGTSTAAVVGGTTTAAAASSTAATIAAAASAIGAVTAVVGTFMSANAASNSGAAQQAEANYVAQQQINNANSEQASGQRAAAVEEQKTRLVESNAAAAAAGSGSTTTDPGVVTDEALIKTEGNYRSLTAMYQGDAKAQNSLEQAATSTYQGSVDAAAGNTKYDTTLINGASSLFQKYGSIPNVSGALNSANTQTAYTLNKAGFGNTAYDMLDGTN